MVDAYMISYGGFLLLAGRLGDLVGRKRVFLVGLVLFTLASAACGFADGQVVLIVARFVQGFGGAVCAAVIVAIVATEFPRPAERATAMSVYTFTAVSGGTIGLLLGGVIVDSIDWHWIFFINVPIGVLTWVLGRALIEESEGIGLDQGVDVLGALLGTASLMLGATRSSRRATTAGARPTPSDSARRPWPCWRPSSWSRGACATRSCPCASCACAGSWARALCGA